MLLTRAQASIRLHLVEKDLNLDQNEEIAEIFNDFFTKAVSNLNIPQYEDRSVNFEQTEDPIIRVIE